MTIETFPFDNSTVATELQWQRMARMWMPDGIDTPPNGTSLRATSGSGLTTTVEAHATAGAHAFCRGFFYRQLGNLSVGHPTNGSSLPRMDRVVLRTDLNANTIQPIVLAGTPATTPVAPGLANTETLFDQPLSRVRVEADDTISQRWDERRFLGRPLMPCTSQNRPDPHGRPTLAVEQDTGRVIFTSGDGNWTLGMSEDLYRPHYTYSGDNGTTTSTNWDSTLTNSATATLAITFKAPPSGRAFVHIGAYISNAKTGSGTTTEQGGTSFMAIRLTQSGGTPYWAVRNTSSSLGTTFGADRMVFMNSAATGETTGGNCSSTFYASSLVPNATYTATLLYAVSSGSGTFDDRFIKIDPVP